jgi:hypothetical protein
MFRDISRTVLWARSADDGDLCRRGNLIYIVQVEGTAGLQELGWGPVDGEAIPRAWYAPLSKTAASQHYLSREIFHTRRVEPHLWHCTHNLIARDL